MPPKLDHMEDVGPVKKPKKNVPGISQPQESSTKKPCASGTRVKGNGLHVASAH